MIEGLNWFEIPAADIDRAMAFYAQILDVELEKGSFGPGYPMSMLPAGGALVQGESYVPSAAGSLVYLNGGEDLSVILDRVPAAGGKVIRPKSSIGENGYVAFFEDSEGNRVGLHSMG